MKKNTKNEKIVSVYIGGDQYIDFTKTTYRKFKHSYFESIKEVEHNELDKNDYAIVSSNGDIITLSYAKYVLDYLEASFKEVS